MTKEEITKEFEIALKNIEDFQNGNAKNRIATLHNVNKFKKLFNKFLNDAFMTRIRDANGKELKIGDTVSFEYCKKNLVGTIIGYDRTSDKVTVKYGESRLDECYEKSEDVIRLE